MSGGFNSYEDEGQIPQRLDLLIEALTTIEADFVTLIDTFRWNTIFSDEQLKKLFGYEYIFRIILEDDYLQKKGWDNGMVVMTHLADVEFEKISLGSRYAIKSMVPLGSKKIDIFSTYLNDKDEDIRLEQLNKLFTHINKNSPCVLTGDFNSIDQGDWSKYGSEILHMFARFPSLKSMEKALFQMERGEVTARIKQQGFVDADEIKRRRTIPSRLFPMNTVKPILRLDYAFYNNLVRLREFRVLTGALFDYTSDHYPITFELE